MITDKQSGGCWPAAYCIISTCMMLVMAVVMVEMTVVIVITGTINRNSDDSENRAGDTDSGNGGDDSYNDGAILTSISAAEVHISHGAPAIAIRVENLHTLPDQRAVVTSYSIQQPIQYTDPCSTTSTHNTQYQHILSLQHPAAYALNCFLIYRVYIPHSTGHKCI